MCRYAAEVLHCASPGVFSKTWDVTLPQSIVSITNSCFTVPCRFEVPDDQEANLLNCSDRGLWRKGRLSGPVVLDSQNPFNNKGQIVGDLTKKNCTTVFSSFPKDYGDMYFFRLECPNAIKYTFSDGVMITFQPAPPPPSLTFVSHVSEGAQVRLQCSVPVLCSILPPSLTWLPRDSSRQEDTQMLQQTADGHMMMTSTLTFKATADHQNQSIVCSVSYPLSQGGSTTQGGIVLQAVVLYVPRFTTATLSTSGPVSEGRTVIFTCSSDANPPVSRYSWHRDNHGTLTTIGQGETLVLQVSQEDSGVYLCEAQNSRGSDRSRPLSLEVSDLMVVPYIICGVVLVLYILTVVQIEVKGEHTYTDLRTVSVTSDYDQLQVFENLRDIFSSKMNLYNSLQFNN
uniref:Si:ch211-171h4.5 n=1 Tax=Seriola lalandi dorsalis TaxID=1841481 RepID=A0A3B4XR17_SERLL